MQIDPRFLATAVAGRIISRKQAQRIYNTHQALSQNGFLPLRSGEVSVMLRILTPDTVQGVLTNCNEYRSRGVRLEDPLYAKLLRRDLAWLRIPYRVLAGLVLLTGISATFLLSHYNWGSTAAAGTILSSILYALALMLSEHTMERVFVWNRSYRIVLTSLCFLTISHAVFVAFRLRNVYLNFPTGSTRGEFLGLWRRLAADILVIIVFLALFGVVAIWRHWEIWAHEHRITLTHSLVAFTCGPVPTSDRPEPWTQDYAWPSSTQYILTLTARIMSLNVWCRFLTWLVSRFSNEKAERLKSITIWYLEPASDTPDRFNILFYAAPDAPGDVGDALEAIKANHHPVRLDETRFGQALRDCSSEDGHLDHRKFLEYPRRSEFISITGFVYDRRCGIPSGNAKMCLAFDHSYLKAVQRPLSPRVTRWLDYRCFAAYPVFEHGYAGASRPHGVLIGCRNIGSGLTPEDQDLLATASCLLGIVLTAPSRRERRKEPDDRKVE